MKGFAKRETSARRHHVRRLRDRLRATTENSGAPVNAPGTATMAQILPNFTHLVAQVKPAVVSITNRLNPNTEDQGPVQGELPQLPFLFNQLIPNFRSSSTVSKRAAQVSLSTPTAPSSPITTS